MILWSKLKEYAPLNLPVKGCPFILICILLTFNQMTCFYLDELGNIRAAETKEYLLFFFKPATVLLSDIYSREQYIQLKR